AKMILKINTDGTYGFYTDESFTQTVSESSSSSIYSFSRGAIDYNEVYFGFYCQDKAIGEYLAAETSVVKYNNVTSSLVLEGSTQNFEVFAVDKTELGDERLGWGQFCWNDKEVPL